MKRALIALAVIATVYSLQDVQNMACSVGCKRSSYTDGVAAQSKKKWVCWCMDLKGFESVTGRRLTISPSIPGPGKVTDYSPPQADPPHVSDPAPKFEFNSDNYSQ